MNFPLMHSRTRALSSSPLSCGDWARHSPRNRSMRSSTLCPGALPLARKVAPAMSTNMVTALVGLVIDHFLLVLRGIPASLLSRHARARLGREIDIVGLGRGNRG